ncbi:MAG TPA: hypothetical protein VFR97_01640 [Capillimicrobium sp.]|nr:hypothetical protein [Capillimicrobium sp.]
MSRTQRSLVLALAVVVLVVGFVIARSAGDDDGDGASSTTATTAAQAQTQAAAPEGEAGSEADAKAEATEDEATAPAEPKPQLIVVKGGAPVGGVARLEATKGDRVEFRVRSDAPDELHVHGYEIEEELPAGRTVDVSFPADIDGRFEIELHGSETQIAELEVQP